MAGDTPRPIRELSQIIEMLNTMEAPEKLTQRVLEVAREAVYAHRSVVLVPANRELPRTEPPVGAWQRVGDLYLLIPSVGKPMKEKVHRRGLPEPQWDCACPACTRKRVVPKQEEDQLRILNGGKAGPANRPAP